ncbi:MAG TPA: DoxX family protein [Ktedonobacteraceae bacterium]|nr:DoxX family protein [Ktedonobacteraceae bacterium]
MDSTPHSMSSTSDELSATLPAQQEGDIVEAQAHIHLPNPSFWPILISLAIAIALGGVLFISGAPWISLLALVFVLVCAIGWAIEDPMAPMKEKYVTIYQAVDPWKFKLHQNVVDSEGKWLGEIRARFPRYILVERGGLFPKVYYVPQSAIRDEIKNNTIFLALSEDDLVHMELNRLPDDLYYETPDLSLSPVRGIPQFARRPLSPAETGHYNYGRMSPGINTDASGSYHRDEVQPHPRDYVTEGMYSTEKQIPPRTISPD